MAVKWVGIDFGQCLMEPTGLRSYLLLGDVLKAYGKPDIIRETQKKFRALVEACGGHSPMKESHRDKIHSYVFDGDDEAMEYTKRMDELKPGQILKAEKSTYKECKKKCAAAKQKNACMDGCMGN